MKKENLFKTIKQLVGVLFYSFGVSAIVFSSIGASPIDAATYYINKLIPLFENLVKNIPGQSGQGIWLIIFNIIIALGLLIAIKKNNIGINVIISIVIGLLFNLGMSVLQSIFSISGVLSHDNSIIIRIAVAIIGINFMSFGIGYLAYYKLFGTPFDELAIAVEEKVKKYYIAKIILDGAFLIIALILGLFYRNVFEQIGLFTIVVLFALGPLINQYINLLHKINKKKELKEDGIK